MIGSANNSEMVQVFIVCNKFKPNFQNWQLCAASELSFHMFLGIKTILCQFVV